MQVENLPSQPPAMSLATDSVIAKGEALVVRPPDRPAVGCNLPTVFLAGPTSSRANADWRSRIRAALADLNILILNPKNASWDSTWREDASDPRWAAQVDWEMDMRAGADIVVFFFEAGSDAPVSLLELGLSLGARDSDVLVYAAMDYPKKGYVEEACKRFQVPVAECEDTLLRCLRTLVEQVYIQKSADEVLGVPKIQ